jgi:hypothetical protein
MTDEGLRDAIVERLERALKAARADASKHSMSYYPQGDLAQFAWDNDELYPPTAWDYVELEDGWPELDREAEHRWGVNWSCDIAYVRYGER